MDTALHISEKRDLNTIDLVCMLIIGLGLGSLATYYYATSHPMVTTQVQSHTIVSPQNTGNEPTGKTPAKPSLNYEQF